MIDRASLLAKDDRALLAECDVDRLRGSGRGGQKRNKTESSIRVRHKATGLSALCGDTRSQPVNKQRALRRLRERFAFEWRDQVDLDDYKMPAELAAWVAEEPVRKSERWLRSTEYLLAVGQLLDLFQACGCSRKLVLIHTQMSSGKLSKMMRIDHRLTRRMAELETTLRGSPAV